MVEKNRATPYAKEFEEDFRKWCEAKAEGKKRKKVEKLFTEVVQVRHELWSDEEDEGITKDDTNSKLKQKQIKTADENDCHTSSVTNPLETKVLATPSGDADESSEDEAAQPMPDKSVFDKGHS